MNDIDKPKDPKFRLYWGKDNQDSIGKTVEDSKNMEIVRLESDDLDLLDDILTDDSVKGE